MACWAHSARGVAVAARAAGASRQAQVRRASSFWASTKAS